MIVYKEAGRDELKEAAELQIESFSGYSFFEMYIENKEKRLRFLRAIQEVEVKAFYKKHIVLVGVQENKIVSVALLKSPDKSEVGLLDYALAGGFKILFAGGPINTFGFLKMLEEAGSVCHRLPGRVWYLESLAVSASCQGQGLGSKMLEDCIKPFIAKRGGGSLALITNAERNRIFYKKNGFEEFHETVISRNGKRIGSWSYRMKIGEGFV